MEKKEKTGKRFYNVYARSRQFLLGKLMDYIPQKQLRCRKEQGLSVYIRLLQEKKIRKILIATTQGMIQRGSIRHILRELEEHAIDTAVYTDISPDPTSENVQRCAGFFLKEHCEAILAIGGGSVIDCAKIAGALVVNPGKTVRDISGQMHVRKRTPFFAAIPTTAGTGSEVTAGAVITDTDGERHCKHLISDFSLVPDIAILDARYTVTMPKELTANTGMDALSHAVEAYTNCFADRKTKEAARRSVRLIVKNLEKAYQNGDDIRARAGMLDASYLAGYAITHNLVGYIHALSHAVNGCTGLPHGYLNAILMPAVLEHYQEAVWKTLSELAVFAGIPGISLENAESTMADCRVTGKIDKRNREYERNNAEAFISYLRGLNRRLGIPSRIPGLKESDFCYIAERAAKEANPAYPVPAIWDTEDMYAVLHRVI